MLGVFVAVHAVRELVLSPHADQVFLLLFAFVPARYAGALPPYPGGLAADAWSFVSYAFIHGGLAHLGLNGLWFLAFASPLARRFGTLRFVLFFLTTAAAGAAAHLVTHIGDPAMVVGASAAISGFMAAAIRFAFQSGGPLGLLGRTDERAYRVEAASLSSSLRNPRIVAFLAAWFGLNLLFGTGVVSLGEADEPIAWQAHIGGFLAGLLGFSAFDRSRPQESSTVDSPGADGMT